MKVLITGACGHIGSFLSENIHKIKGVSRGILVDNLKSNRFNSLYNFEKKNNLSFFLRDLNNLNALNDFHNVDAIIHCASMTNAEKSFGKEKEMYRNNLNCLKTTMRYCINRNTKLIHLSSTSVYGKQTDLVDENCERRFLKPQSPYAKIKLIEEKLLKKNSNKLRYNTFRFGTIAGVSRGIRFHTAVNNFCLNAAIGEKIKIYKTALHQYRPYLSIRDSFKVFKFCLEKDFFENDIFNALSGNFTVNQILDKIKKIKKKINVVYVNSPIMNQLSYHVDDQKIKNKGLILKSNIDVDIKDTLLLFKYLKNEM
jgi:nucleoside-diphosphate-sugar epimerase|tara:strand:- start:300 stop:1235 length:936 start_codon:yes stop_codon:yes gene_type:complete